MKIILARKGITPQYRDVSDNNNEPKKRNMKNKTKNQTAEYGTPSNPCKPLSLDHRAPKHLSEQTINVIEARQALLKVADRLEAVIETNQLNHSTAFGNLLFHIRGEVTQVKIDANELLGKAN